MSSTPAPTPHIASVGLQVQVFLCYTISSVGVAYFILRLARSLCKGEYDDESGGLAIEAAAKSKRQKIIFWTSFVTICLFFYRSILIWGGMLYHLVDDDDNVTNNFAFSISFAGYGLGIKYTYIFMQPNHFYIYAGLWLMLLTFVVRIDYTFRGSFLAYSARQHTLKKSIRICHNEIHQEGRYA